MQENFDLVQRGFRVLLCSLSGYIAQEMSRSFGDGWWREVLYVLNDQRDLPYDGSYGELVDSLDVANCIRLLDREWNAVFSNALPLNCRTWAKELMGIRNIVAHIGMQDLDQPTAERALNTMLLLCREVDPEGAEELNELYREIRSRADDVFTVQYSGIAQPDSESKRGALQEGSLLQLVDTDLVQRTTLTRKVTYAGKTIVYPVYKVRLDSLFYNDQNDRISTWISDYESENGKNSLSELNTETYNRIIENFIYESNPESIQKTQKNISLVGQREPGVTLADGRIVDGNRRFTCLRRIQREQTEPAYFETVIMDVDIREDKKQIKLLELAIQHGEEKKVDYDLIDFAIGTHRDVVQTKLLTVEEYASGTNETAGEVKKRIAIAGLINEFLSYAGLPEQYHVAREYQVMDLFQEMMAPLNQLNDEEKTLLKRIVFSNVLMKAIPDQRKFIRDIKNLVKNGAYASFFEEQKNLCEETERIVHSEGARTKADLEKAAEAHREIADTMQYSMERALQQCRSAQLKMRPSENVTKSITLLLDIDTRLFSRLEEEEKEKLSEELSELSRIAENLKKIL